MPVLCGAATKAGGTCRLPPRGADGKHCRHHQPKPPKQLYRLLKIMHPNGDDLGPDCEDRLASEGSEASFSLDPEEVYLGPGGDGTDLFTSVASAIEFWDEYRVSTADIHPDHGNYEDLRGDIGELGGLLATYYGEEYEYTYQPGTGTWGTREVEIKIVAVSAD